MPAAWQNDLTLANDDSLREIPADTLVKLVYDGSFPGLLTALFLTYEHRIATVTIQRPEHYEADMLAVSRAVSTDDNKADRVQTKLDKLLGAGGVRQLIAAFLSELPGCEDTILGVVRYAIANPDQRILQNFAHPDVLALSKLCKSVSRERHRMTAFVRFQQMDNDIYFATIDPDFNVLPLILSHFKNRYQDQHWAIYDQRRDYGIYYNLDTVELIDTLDPKLLQHPEQFFSAHERDYQSMWQGYFQSANIKERNNHRLHLRHIPYRYWRYLTEKHPTKKPSKR